MYMNRLKKQLRIFKNARAIMRHYLRWPYRLNKVTSFNDFNHEHVCFAARFANVDLAEICPLKDKKQLRPGDQDQCELCRYFGTIYFQRNAQTDEKQISFEMSGKAVSLLENREINVPHEKGNSAL